MSAIVDDITVEQGSTYIEYVDCFDDEAGTIPTVLTGWTGRGQIRLKATDAAALAEITVTPASGAVNRVKIEIPAAESSAIPLKGAGYKDKTQAYYDVELVNGADVTRLKNGIAWLSPEITK